MTIQPALIGIRAMVHGTRLGPNVWQQALAEADSGYIADDSHIRLSGQGDSSGHVAETTNTILIAEPHVGPAPNPNRVQHIERDEPRRRYVYHMADGSEFYVSDEQLQVLGTDGMLVQRSDDATQVLTPIPLPEPEPVSAPSPLRRGRQMQLD